MTNSHIILALKHNADKGCFFHPRLKQCACPFILMTVMNNVLKKTSAIVEYMLLFHYETDCSWALCGL